MRLLTIIFFLIIGSNNMNAQIQGIREQGLKLAVKLSNAKGRPIGSGFFYEDSTSLYLVTAKHVLLTMTENGTVPAFRKFNIEFFGKEQSFKEKSKVEIDLEVLIQDSKYVKFNEKDDILVIKIGDFKEDKILHPDVIKLPPGKFRPEVVYYTWMKKFDEIYYGSESWIIGYPESLNLVALNQYNFNVPLLRRGIVAGKYAEKKTFVIDCPSFPGNSGGPVFNSIRGRTNDFSIVGIVVALIPYAERWTNKQFNIVNTEFSNSGYSIIEPMDKVLDLINE